MFFIKSSSNLSNKSIDHKPKILCLFSLDLTKYKLLSLCSILALYSSIILGSKNGVSDGKVAIHLYGFLFFFIHFIELSTPANGPRSSKQSGITVIFFISSISKELLETINISLNLSTIFNKTCSSNVLDPSFTQFLSCPNLLDFPPASTTAKILLSSINQNIKH